MSRLLRYACGALLAASMSACGPTAKEKQVMSELTSRMKPVCMGRFVMDVPEGMRFGGHVTLYYGLGINFKKVEAFIESHDARPESMREQMDARARTIDQGDKNWETKRSMLLEYRPVNEHMIYLRKQGDLISAAGSDHELHVLVGKTQLVLKPDVTRPAARWRRPSRWRPGYSRLPARSAPTTTHTRPARAFASGRRSSTATTTRRLPR